MLLRSTRVGYHNIFFTDIKFFLYFFTVFNLKFGRRSVLLFRNLANSSIRRGGFHLMGRRILNKRGKNSPSQYFTATCPGSYGSYALAIPFVLQHSRYFSECQAPEKIQMRLIIPDYSLPSCAWPLKYIDAKP